MTRLKQTTCNLKAIHLSPTLFSVDYELTVKPFLDPLLFDSFELKFFPIVMKNSLTHLNLHPVGAVFKSDEISYFFEGKPPFYMSSISDNSNCVHALIEKNFEHIESFCEFKELKNNKCVVRYISSGLISSSLNEVVVTKTINEHTEKNLMKGTNFFPHSDEEKFTINCKNFDHHTFHISRVRSLSTNLINTNFTQTIITKITQKENNTISSLLDSSTLDKLDHPIFRTSKHTFWIVGVIVFVVLLIICAVIIYLYVFTLKKETNTATKFLNFGLELQNLRHTNRDE